MPRDYRNLRAFKTADDLVTDIYRLTRAFPDEERYGLTAQIRRAAVSVPNNIVEGSGRRSTSEYLQFVNCAIGSAYEVRYLLTLSCRLEMLSIANRDALLARYDHVIGALANLIAALEPTIRRRSRAMPRGRRSATAPSQGDRVDDAP
jgi:four helix bundle protein